jgi:tetratricopeptide (TPR) repeat protein
MAGWHTDLKASRLVITTVATAGLLSACAVSSHRPPALTAPASSSAEARLADADDLAARGCYLCLLEASAAYEQLLTLPEPSPVARRALETNLMLALREVELRLPDSGARARAEALRQRVAFDYSTFFDVLDAAYPTVFVGNTVDDILRRRAARPDLADRLLSNAHSDAVAAYFYLTALMTAGPSSNFKSEVIPPLEAFPQDLALKYRLQTSGQTFSQSEAMELLSKEPRFGELHYVLGERAILNADLVTAYREVTAALQTLPQSLSFALVRAYLDVAFARYANALGLFDQVLAVANDAGAQMGRAKTLSYLKRHREALEMLDVLLMDTQNNPGEKYYWRAWNRLQLQQPQAAYEDALAALKVMANSDVYRLAGIAAFDLGRLLESRTHFESSLKMNAADCDALRYLGQIDAAEGMWPAAANQFTVAASCYQQTIEHLSAELSEKRADTSGLLESQIAALQVEINDAKVFQDQSEHNAGIASRNAANRNR